MPTRYLSLSEKNQFTFTCPVFDTKVKMGTCMMLRDLVWRGKRHEKRRGCQAAMSCGMCPTAAMVSLYSYNAGWQNDHHGSAEPREGRLRSEVLSKVANVIARDSVLNEYAVPPAERRLMLTASERVAAQLRGAPGDKASRGASDYVAPKKTRRTADPKPALDTSAAKSGDLAAAINA